jgi:hypothetical protein
MYACSLRDADRDIGSRATQGADAGQAGMRDINSGKSFVI